jgi:hypothetical protein
MAIEIVDLAIKNGDFPWRTVNLPDGKDGWTQMFLGNPATHRPYFSSSRLLIRAGEATF